MSAPLVSVIIPCYNVEPYLQECLDSVINQTLKDIEIICVDDGSTDDTLRILKKYESKDKRIKVFTQKNQGAGVARNLALKYANGQYLSFLDGDDYYDLTFAEKMYTNAIKMNLDVLICSAKNFNINTNIFQKMGWSLNVDMLPKENVFSYKDMKKYIFNFSQNWNWNKLFKKEFIDLHNIKFQDLRRTNDLLFTNKALILAERISVLQEDLVTYRVGMNNNSQQTNHLYPEDFLRAFYELMLFLKNKNVFVETKQSFYTALIGGILYNYRSIKFRKIKKKLLKSIRDKWSDLFELNSVKIDELNQPSYYRDYIDLMLSLDKKKTWYQKIFSIKKSKDNRYLIIYFLWIRVKFRCDE